MYETLAKPRKAVSVDHALAMRAKEEKKRTAARAHLEQCERDYKSATLDGVLNSEEAGAAKERKSLELARADDSHAAQRLAAAVQVENDAHAADQASKRAAQVAEIASHAAQREGIAADVTELATALCEKWREFQELSAKMENVGLPLPSGAICGWVEQKRALEKELYRVGGDPSIAHTRSFPGADPHDLNMLSQPGNIPPLADTVKQANAHILATLNRGAING
jgi:hypothetical protein